MLSFCHESIQMHCPSVSRVQIFECFVKLTNSLSHHVTHCRAIDCMCAVCILPLSCLHFLLVRPYIIIMRSLCMNASSDILLWCFFYLVGNEEALFLLASCHYRMGKPQRAYKLLQSKGFSSPDCRFIMAQCCLDTDKFAPLKIF